MRAKKKMHGSIRIVFFGFENNQYANTREVFRAETYNPVVLQMLKKYEPLLDGAHGIIGCPRLNTDALLKFGLKFSSEKQELKDAVE